MNKLMTVVAWCACSVSLLAAECVFTHEGGSNDIASKDAWGGTLPGESDQVTLSVQGRTETITASADVTFGLLYNGHRPGYNEEIVFDMTACDPVRKLSFKGFKSGSANQSLKHNYFKGGYWDFGGQTFVSGGSGNYGNTRSYYLSDGVVITNTGDMVLGYTSQGKQRVELTGQSKLYVGGRFKFTNNKTARGDENWLKIMDGSKMRIDGRLAWEEGVDTWEAAVKNQPDGDMFYKDYLVVSGTDSEFLSPTADYNYLGLQGGSATIVEDGAKLELANNTCLWYGFTRHNLLRVDNATAKFNNAYGGWAVNAGGGDRSNRVEVVNYGSLTASKFVLGNANNAGDAGSCGNTLVVSNGSFQVTAFELGNTIACSNQFVLIQGKDASFEPGVNFTMFTGANSEYCIEDGAVFKPAPNFSLQIGGRFDERLRVRRNGVLQLAKGLGTACSKYDSASNVLAWRNRLIADAGGIVSGQFVNVQGDACTFEITDAVVVLTNNSAHSINVGYTSDYGGLGTNCVMSIAGSHPCVRLENPLIVQNASRLVFKLPENGYDDGVVPLVCQDKIELKEGCPLEIKGAEELCQNLSKLGVRKEYVLAENPSTAKFFTAAQVAAVAEELPKGAKLKLVSSGGKNRLVLKAGSVMGSMIIFR